MEQRSRSYRAASLFYKNEIGIIFLMLLKYRALQELVC